MNNERRKRLDKLATDVQAIEPDLSNLEFGYKEWQARVADEYRGFQERWSTIKGRFDDEANVLEEIQSDEQEAYDNLSEGLQSADRGQAMSDAIDYMANAHTALEGTPDELEALEFPDLPEFDFEDFAQQVEDAQGE